MGVRFLATGSMYQDIALSHHVVPCSVCRAVRKTIDLLLSVIEDHMSFPTTRCTILILLFIYVKLIVYGMKCV